MRVQISFENRQLNFTDPVSIIQCNEPAQLQKTFQNIESALDKGYYVAGFFSYEAGYCLEERLNENRAYDFPLIMTGAYERPLSKAKAQRSDKHFNVHDLSLNISKQDYSRNIDRIRHYISIGDVYQITYCIKMKFGFSGDPYSLYKRLYRSQPVPYSAYVETKDMNILSLSPERFILKQKRSILSEPMKGTWQRGGNVFADMIERKKFSRDMKNRAENVMIADLLRNDMGRVGSRIRAPKLFTITGYRTLYQMTSTVTGEVPENIKLYDVFRAMFPSGSVTGAPRIRAMEIIRDIEKEDRRIYTGAIGYITPERDMYFSIPIRTILLRGTEGEMGIGGGIVWDSTAEGEWNEGLLKARFLSDRFS